MRSLAAFGCSLFLALGCGTVSAFELLSFPAGTARGGALATAPVAGALRAAVNGTALRDAQAGTAVTLAVSSGRTFTFVLDRQVAHNTDSVTWTGTLQGKSNDFRMVLTYSPEASFGKFITPDGTFMLDTFDSQTWLVDMQASGLRQPAPRESDGIAPPPRQQAKAAGAPPVAALPPSPQTTIDVLVLYSPGMVTRIGTVNGVIARINNLVALSNQAYFDSDIAITLRLLQASQINGVTDNTDNTAELYALTDGTGPYTGVLALRDAIGADMVTVIRPFVYPDHVSCGVAWIGGYNLSNIATYEEYGYSIVSDGTSNPYYCLDLTYAHELGHNMGSRHDRITDAGNFPPYGSYAYAFGYGVANTFATVMAYGQSFAATVIGKFSNPSLLCFGLPCGVPDTNPQAANAKAFNNNRAGVASWRMPMLQTLAPSAPAQFAAASAGGFPVVRWFELAPRAKRSYELQLLNVTSTTSMTAAGDVARFDAPGANQLQDSSCLDVGCTTRTMRWIAAADSNERVRVANAATAPPASAVYTVQLRETTLYCPRWSEAGGQSSVLAVQRTQSDEAGSCNATAYFYDEGGAELSSQAFAFAANKVNVQALGAVGGLPGAKGSVAIAHTCGIGGLKGVVTALEPSTGYSFGTPCSERAR
jgi:hypothetical protein